MKQKQDRKIYVVGGSVGYANWMEGKLVDDMESSDLVVGSGGSDWHPSYYGEPLNKKTGFCTHTDEYEYQEFQKAIKLNKHIVGICRSSQAGSVVSSGK